MEREIALFDIHAPVHSKTGLRVVYDFIEDFKPKKIIIGGDFMNLSCISHWKDGKMGALLNEDIEDDPDDDEETREQKKDARIKAMKERRAKQWEEEDLLKKQKKDKRVFANSLFKLISVRLTTITPPQNEKIDCPATIANCPAGTEKNKPFQRA